MMNRKQFQDWLDHFPEDAEIKVACHKEAPSYAFSWHETFDGCPRHFDYSNHNGNSMIYLGEIREA